MLVSAKKTDAYILAIRLFSENLVEVFFWFSMSSNIILFWLRELLILCKYYKQPLTAYIDGNRFQGIIEAIIFIFFDQQASI
jgi:hypothetical protein